jgi:hypothetical protein
MYTDMNKCKNNIKKEGGDWEDDNLKSTQVKTLARHQSQQKSQAW